MTSNVRDWVADKAESARAFLTQVRQNAQSDSRSPTNTRIQATDPTSEPGTIAWVAVASRCLCRNSQALGMRFAYRSRERGQQVREQLMRVDRCKSASAALQVSIGDASRSSPNQAEEKSCLSLP